jgi:sugar phosphate isomerase/epimerase
VIVSAFADEIASRVDVQLEFARSHGIGHLDLRSVAGRNVVELDDREVLALREALHAHGLSAATIASPIGKEPSDVDQADLRRRTARAGALAHLLETDLVRVFGFRPPAGGGDWRESSLRSLGLLASCAREEGITLLLENEVGTRAANIEHALDLLASLGDDHVRAAFDPANALRCGETPYPDGYARLKPWIRQVHVKDLDGGGRVVPAGFGEVDWPGLLDALGADGYDGLVSLEPHLLRAGAAGGFTGPTLFGEAHRALQRLLAPDRIRPTIGSAADACSPVILRTGELRVAPDGTVRNAPHESVFWAVDGVLEAPAPEPGSGPSATREAIMRALETVEASARPDDLLGADEVFLVSASGELRPVGRLDDVVFEAPGPLCRAARRALDEAIARDALSEEEKR